MKECPRTSVLIVDDDPAVLRLLRQILTTAGYGVYEATDGRQAMAEFKKHPTDLLITDLIMPDQEGVETLTKLRRTAPALKVIAISGAVGGKYLRVAELVGAHAVLQKPFNPESLLAMVRKVLC